MSFLLLISSYTSGYLLKGRVCHVTLQYLEVWPPSKGLSLPLELPQCLFLIFFKSIWCCCAMSSYFISDFALLGLFRSDACQFLLCCLFVGVFCLLCFFP
jgi:hypothetical protein